MPYDPEKYAENKEVFLKYQQKYREENREKERLRHKIYREQHKEEHAGYERKRRSLKRSANHLHYTVEDVLLKWGTDCYVCSLPIDLTVERRTGRPGWEMGLHIDHVVPIVSGGDDTIDNVRPAHGICNAKKNKYETKELIGA